MAENDGKIYITISNRQMGQGGEQPGAPEEKKSDNKNILMDYMKDSFFHALRSTATQAVNYGISNYGNFTGDYYTQREMEDAKSAINSLIGFGSAFMSGIAIGGPTPVGIAAGIIAVGVKASTDLISFGAQELLRYRENQGQNYEIAQLRKLSGLNTLLDGSRGTLN